MFIIINEIRHFVNIYKHYHFMQFCYGYYYSDNEAPQIVECKSEIRPIELYFQDRLSCFIRAEEEIVCINAL